MKPSEFWNCTYREINTFVQSNLCRDMDSFRQDIRLLDATTDKMIQADAMSNKRPRIVSLQKTFESLFPKKEKKQASYQDIKEKMRELMKR